MADLAHSTSVPFRDEVAERTFAGLSFRELSLVYEAAELAMNAHMGVYNRPACKNRSGASDWIHDEIERCTDIMQAVANEAETLRPMTSDDAKLKAEILIRWGLECGSWKDVACAMILEPTH